MGRCPKQQWWLAGVMAFSPGWESNQRGLGCCEPWQRGAWSVGPDQGKVGTGHHFTCYKLERRESSAHKLPNSPRVMGRLGWGAPGSSLSATSCSQQGYPQLDQVAQGLAQLNF